MDEIISYRNYIEKSLIINGFKKKYGIEKNYMQNAFMISKLHISALVKRFASLRFPPTVNFIGLVTLDCTCKSLLGIPINSRL